MKIAILGYGKMGKTIERLALEKGDKIVLKIGKSNLKDLTKEAIKKADVAIEFSEPSSAFENIKFCLKNNIPVVSGTTAWLERLEEAKAICAQKNGAFFYASNFSVGVNIFFKLNEYLAKMMVNFPDYAINMEEIHHTEKKDAPSGTAITLAEAILENYPPKEHWVNESTDDFSKIPIISKRIPNVPGTHTIDYNSTIDSIKIHHEAYSREGFALGALSAARWLIGKQGFFGMEDMLKV